MSHLRRLKHSALALGLAATLSPALSYAGAIDPGLSIVGTTSLYLADADLATATWSANLYNVVGGVNSGGAANSLALTDTGDGFGHTASLSGNNSSLTRLGGDYDVTATNSTADEYKLTFGITFFHSADSDAGDLDARTVAEMEVTDDVDSEYLFSRLTSESGEDYFNAGNATWQDQIHDEVSDQYLGTWGDALSFGETRYFDVTLAGGTSFDITGIFDLDGRIFDDGASFAATSEMFLFLDSFENVTNPPVEQCPPGTTGTPPNCVPDTGPPGVPVPGSLALIGLGLLALGGRRRRS